MWKALKKPCILHLRFWCSIFPWKIMNKIFCPQNCFHAFFLSLPCSSSPLSSSHSWFRFWRPRPTESLVREDEIHEHKKKITWERRRSLMTPFKVTTNCLTTRVHLTFWWTTEEYWFNARNSYHLHSRILIASFLPIKLPWLLLQTFFFFKAVK